MKTELALLNLDIYQSNLPLLQGINFTARAGENIALVGNNGVGKTTLLKTMAGLLKPFSGMIKLNHADLHQMPFASRATHLSLLFQTSPAQPYCLAKDRIAHGLMPVLGINHPMGPNEVRLIEEIAHRLNISALLNRPLYKMSGGELRLVNIAKCLINPELKVILLDEPSVFLDLTQKSNLARILKKQAELGRITLFSSHDMDFIRDCATKIIHIENKTVRL